MIGAPARADELTLGRRRRDLGVLVLFATAVGALAALWLSGIVARQLARPIGTLRQAALSIAGGARTLSFDDRADGGVQSGVQRVSSNGGRPQLESQRARGGAAPHVGRASQRGERRRRRRLGRPRVAGESARRVGARAARWCRA